MNYLISFVAFLVLSSIFIRREMRKAPWYNEEYNFYYTDKELFIDSDGNECVMRVIDGEPKKIIHLTKKQVEQSK